MVISLFSIIFFVHSPMLQKLIRLYNPTFQQAENFFNVIRKGNICKMANWKKNQFRKMWLCSSQFIHQKKQDKKTEINENHEKLQY